MDANDTSDLSDSVIFSDEYFGDYYNDFALMNGRFEHWTVNDNPSEVGCGPEYQNAFGLLRAVDNAEGNPSITRYGGSICDGDPFITASLEIYDFCLENMTNIVDFTECNTIGVYDTVPVAIGGSRSSFVNQSVDDFPFCIWWHNRVSTIVCVSSIYCICHNQIADFVIKCRETDYTFLRLCD